MEETEFWGRLEYRICDEFRGFEDDHLRWYWCDGLVPERYDRHGGHWHISGRAWIETQNRPARQRRRVTRQEPWTFTLIATPAGERDEINWEQLLPSDRLTGWLAPPTRSQRLRQAEKGRKTDTCPPRARRRSRSEP